MSYEEKGVWAYLTAVVGTYTAYLVIILGRLATTPVSQVHYAVVLLWTTVASTAVSVVVRTAIETARPSDGRRKDVRDREIYRFGEYASRWLVVLAAGAAMLMAMARWDYFWIANVIYLGFVLWAVVGSVLKVVAYRRGL
ncbi:MAG: hypothetical protein J2P15_17200 [Micromonosporaceae bacterium]|nr:hypothetical protein [Micromonosporaceae bacterium]